MLTILPDYSNAMNSFEMTLNSKHRAEKLKPIKTKDTKTWKTKTWKDENLVLVLPKE